MNIRQLRELFLFTAKERNGLLILVFILFLVIGGNYFLPYFISEKEYDTSSWRKEVEKYYHDEIVLTGQKDDASEQVSGNSADAQPDLRERGSSGSFNDFTTISKDHSSPLTGNSSLVKGTFTGSFNPNNAELNVLLQIGIPAKVAGNWIKYLQKGGKFYKKEDVTKLYGMNEEIYDKVKGHLFVPDKILVARDYGGTEKSPKKSFAGFPIKDSVRSSGYKVKVEISKVDINLADSIQLEALPGIGPALASRIIKYRKLLGGFYQVNQLKDIYGMNEEWWSKISPFLIVGNIRLEMLEINYLSLVEMGRHPYIGFRTAKKIIKMRDTVGKFRTQDEFALLFSGDSLQRILPYLALGTTKE
ncbi:MAG: helix-hairpin-helix domain-containing protein [Prolixibacteraceae bacterium]